MIRMVAPPSLFVQGGSWRATRHLLIRAHGASGKVARGGHVTSSGSQPTVYRRPARTFVLPAPRVQDGLTISPSPFREQADSKAPTDHIPDNGQVERINRTIKDATVKRYHYESNGQLVRHLDDFVAAYNFARRLKTLNGLTPYEFICKRWTIEPKRFSLNPLQQIPGLPTECLTSRFATMSAMNASATARWEARCVNSSRRRSRSRSPAQHNRPRTTG